MKILVTGATGFVGKQVCKHLICQGHDLVVLTRNPKTAENTFPLPASFYEWKDFSKPPSEQAFEGVEAIIHLMGESIAEGRWTKSKKQRLYSSRVDSTKSLVKAVNEYKNHKIQRFLSTSAVGIYPDSLEITSEETSALGDGYLAELCKAWEAPLQELSEAVSYTVLRLGIVLGNGGALEKLSQLFSYGLTSPLGSGKQWMSWIHIEDLSRLFVELLSSNENVRVVNAVANSISNYDFHRSLAAHMNRPLLPATPSFVLQMALGEMSQALLASQKVSNKSLTESDFKFEYNSLEKALENLLPFGSFSHCFEDTQFFPNQNKDLFDFFSSEQNLEEITPAFLNFKVLGKDTENIQEGTHIDYSLKLYGVPMKWKTEIRTWKPGHEFKDFQLKGPYKVWDHTHSFIETPKGLLMSDKVFYKLPFAALSEPVSLCFVKKNVFKIFNYRRSVLEKRFGK